MKTTGGITAAPEMVALAAIAGSDLVESGVRQEFRIAVQA
jgi:hypothetical protein